MRRLSLSSGYSIVRNIQLLMFLLFMCEVVFAQQLTISGTVTDEQTGEPVPYVNVLFKGTTIGTVTDSTGNYVINRPLKSDTLNFSAIGYYPVKKTSHDFISGSLSVKLRPKLSIFQKLK